MTYTTFTTINHRHKNSFYVGETFLGLKKRPDHEQIKSMQTKISTSQGIVDYINQYVINEEHQITLKEYFWAIFLNRSNKIVGFSLISEGGIAGTTADPKIILCLALLNVSSSVILVHNHPSGNTEPSDADRYLTRKIGSACACLDMPLLDHIIITEDSYFSFADNNVSLT